MIETVSPAPHTSRFSAVTDRQAGLAVGMETVDLSDSLTTIAGTLLMLASEGADEESAGTPRRPGSGRPAGDESAMVVPTPSGRQSGEKSPAADKSGDSIQLFQTSSAGSDLCSLAKQDQSGLASSVNTSLVYQGPLVSRSQSDVPSSLVKLT